MWLLVFEQAWVSTFQSNISCSSSGQRTLVATHHRLLIMIKDYRQCLVEELVLGFVPRILNMLRAPESEDVHYISFPSLEFSSELEDIMCLKHFISTNSPATLLDTTVC